MGSTNAKAYSLAEQGAAEWTSVVSDIQTRGRGRHGKTWHSPLGGLWLSIVLRPGLIASKAGVLQIACSTAARAAIQTQTGVHALLKWPNDLVLDSGKLGGILVELKTVGSKLAFAVVGIGVNVNQLRESLPEGAVSIRAYTGRSNDLRELLTQTIAELKLRYAALSEPSKIVSEWWNQCIHRLKTVRVDTSQGRIVGKSTGISENGQLIVETKDQRVVNVDEGTLTILD